MDRKHLLNGLGFDEDAIFHQNIEAQRFIASKAFVFDLHDLLGGSGELADSNSMSRHHS